MNLLDLLPKQRQRIDLFAPPYSGHLHPILAIGREIVDYHDVRIISTPGAMQRVHSSGLIGIPILGDHEQELLEIANPNHAVRSNPIRLHRQFKSAIVLLDQLKKELNEIYREFPAPDLMIADFTLPVVGIVASSLNSRWWTSLPSPCVLETPDGPPAYCGGLRPARNWRDSVLHQLTRKKVRLFKTAVFRLYRKPLAHIGFSQLYRADGTEAAYSPDVVLALGNEDIEFNRSWPSTVRFVGPKLFTPPSDSPAPVFRSGKRHILVTIGTHLAWHKHAVVKAVKRLARSRPTWVFHFTDGDIAASTNEEVDNFVRLPYIDYGVHLANYDAVIHHGGAGIMYYCLASKKPSLVYPVDYDQFDHAARLEAAGLGVWLKNGLASIESAGKLLDEILGREK